MEAIVYVNCFRTTKNGFENIIYLGLVYIFTGLCLLKIFMYAPYIIMNGLMDLVSGCYYKKHYFESDNLVISTRLRRRRGNQRIESDLIIIRNRSLTNYDNNLWKSSVVYIQEPFICLICCNNRNEKGIFNNCDHYMCDYCINNICKNECPYCREKIINI